MLAIKKPRKRHRRRQKHLVTRDKSKEQRKSSEINEIIETEDTVQHTKLTTNFVNEDVDVETAAILNQLTIVNKNENNKDEVIIFFIGTENKITNNENIINNNEQNSNEVDQSILYLPQIETTYLNENIENLIEPFIDRNVEIDSSELFLPSLSKRQNDIENAQINIPKYEQTIDDGHYKFQTPSINVINKIQFINRAHENGSYLWLNETHNDLIGIFKLIQNEKLLKSECKYEINTIELLTNIENIINEITNNRILIIELNRLAFHLHPTFLNEHFIVHELCTLYDIYKFRKRLNIINAIEQKLEMTRMHSHYLPLINNSQSYAEYKKFTGLIKNLRNHLHQQNEIERNLKRKIISTWSKLKFERDKCSPITSMQLIILSHKSNEEYDIKEFNKKFHIEYVEMLQESIVDYEYKCRKKNTISLDSNDIIEPPNRREIREKLIILFNKSMRPPGEDIVEFQMKYSHEDDMPWNNCKYVIRIMVDKSELYTIGPVQINKIGNILLNNRFNVKFVSSKSKNVVIEVIMFYLC